MKRILALLLVAVLAVGIAACGSNDPAPSSTPAPAATQAPAAATPAPAAADPEPGQTTMFPPQTITIYNSGTLVTHNTQFSDTPIGRIVEDITGIRVQIEYLGGANDVERAAIIIAAGDFTDVILGSHRTNDFRDAGALIPINDLYDQNCPNIQRLWGNFINRIKDPDTGILWGLSASNLGTGGLNYPDAAFFLKYDAVEMNNNRVITTKDEYFNVIRRYVAENPTTNGQPTIGFGGPAEDWRWVFAVHGGRKMHGWHNTGRFLHDPTNNYVGVAANTMDFNIDYFLFLRQLQEEGLLDPEFFSQTHDEYVAKVAAGRIVGMYDEFWQIGDALALIRNEGRLADLPVPFAIYHPNRVTTMNCAYAGVTAMAATTDISISRQARDPALILQFYDFLTTDAMQELLWWGIEGEHFQKDANGRRYLTAAQYDERQGNVLFGAETGIGHNGMIVPARLMRGAEWEDGSGVTDPAQDRVIRPPLMYSEIEKTVLNRLGWNTFWDGMGDRYVSPYGFGWDISPTEELEDLVDIHNYLNHVGGHGEYGQFFFQHMILAATEAEAMNIWDEMQAWLINNGVHQMEEYFTMRVQERVRDWN
jgi:ABC-type glycerol-3-phosphate transport system substrate-binding protein